MTICKLFYTLKFDSLFHLRYGPLDSASLIASATSDPGTSQKPIPSAGHSTACVRVEVPGATGANELLTCLSNQLVSIDLQKVMVKSKISVLLPICCH